MTHVSRVNVTESKINVGDSVTVHIWIQSDYADIGTPYDVEVFSSTSGANGTWDSITSLPGFVWGWGEFELDPLEITINETGIIYIGAKDKGESDPNNPNYKDYVEAIPPTTPGYGIVSVRSLPSGASIYIDGLYKGVTPKDTQIVAGNHTLRVKKDGYKEITETITVVDQGITSRSFTLEKEDELWGVIMKYVPYIALAGGAAILIWVATTPKGKRTISKYGKKAKGYME